MRDRYLRRDGRDESGGSLFLGKRAAAASGRGCTDLATSCHPPSRSLLTASAAPERLDCVIAAAQFLSLQTGHRPDRRRYRTGALGGAVRGVLSSYARSLRCLPALSPRPAATSLFDHGLDHRGLGEVCVDDAVACRVRVGVVCNCSPTARGEARGVNVTDCVHLCRWLPASPRRSFAATCVNDFVRRSTCAGALSGCMCISSKSAGN